MVAPETRVHITLRRVTVIAATMVLEKSVSESYHPSRARKASDVTQ